MFDAAKDEYFEDGMRSYFAAKLEQFIERHGIVGVNLLGNIIDRSSTSPRVAAEAMRWIPRIDQPVTYEARRALLEKNLLHPHAYVRDGAVLGLSSLDDAHSIAPLRDAIQAERNSELRTDMEQLLAELESIHSEQK